MDRNDRKEARKRMAPTESVRRVVEHATSEAQRLKHNCIGAEHLLLALVELQVGPVPRILIEAGVTPELVRGEMENLPPPAYEWFGSVPFTPRARRILERAELIARKIGSPRISEAHVLSSLLQEPDGKPAEWFAKFETRVDLLKERAFAEITGCK